MAVIPGSQPQIGTVFNTVSLNEAPHPFYDAEIQSNRKDPQVRMTMCGTLDHVKVGEPVMISYHSGMRCYQHSRHVVVASSDNCIGGFYYTDGTSAE